MEEATKEETLDSFLGKLGFSDEQVDSMEHAIMTGGNGDTGFNDFKQLRDKFKTDPKELEDNLREFQDVKSKSISKLMSVLKKLTFNCNFKLKLELKRGISTKSIADLVQDQSAVENLRKIIKDFLGEHPNYPDDISPEARDCKKDVETELQFFLEENDKKIGKQGSEADKLFELVRDLLWWIGASEDGELGNGTEEVLHHLLAKLNQFPWVRHCFHSLANGDSEHVIPLLRKFPELSDVAWIPWKTTLMFQVLRSVQSGEDKIRLVESVLKNSADISQTEPTETAPTLLHVAVDKSDEKLVQLLLDWDADTEATNSDGATADRRGPQPNAVDNIIQQKREGKFPKMLWEYSSKDDRFDENKREWMPVDTALGHKLCVAYKQKQLGTVSASGRSADLQSWTMEVDGKKHHLRLANLVDAGLGREANLCWEMLKDEPGEEWKALNVGRGKHKKVGGSKFEEIHAGRKSIWTPTKAGYTVWDTVLAEQFFVRCRPQWTQVAPSMQHEHGVQAVDDQATDLLLFVGFPKPSCPEFEEEGQVEPLPFKPGRIKQQNPTKELLDANQQVEKLRMEAKEMNRKLHKRDEEIEKLHLKIEERTHVEQDNNEEIRRQTQKHMDRHMDQERQLKAKFDLQTKQHKDLEKQLKANIESMKTELEIAKAKVGNTEGEKGKKAKELYESINREKEVLAQLEEARAANHAANIREKYNLEKLDAAIKIQAEAQNRMNRERELEEKALQMQLVIDDQNNQQQAHEQRRRDLALGLYNVPPSIEAMVIELILSGVLARKLQAVDFKYAEFITVQFDTVNRAVKVWGPRVVLEKMKEVARAWGTLSNRFSSFERDLKKSKESRVEWLTWQLANRDLADLWEVPLTKPYIEEYKKKVAEWATPKLSEFTDKGKKLVMEEANQEIDDPWHRDRWNLFDVALIELSKNLCKESPGDSHKNDVLRDLVLKESQAMKKGIPERVQQNIANQGIDDLQMRSQMQKHLTERFNACHAAFEENRSRLFREMWRQHEFNGASLLKFHVHLEMAKLALPIYAESFEIINNFKRDDIDVLQLECDTGSGKSTVLPMLLMAEFTGKICVTQPRILPCVRTCTFAGNIVGKNLVGAEWADQRINALARLVYVTDGLIMARMLGPDQMKKPPYSVIAFDEVHERSCNIDIAMTFAAIAANELKQNGHRMKIVVMSATLDPECMAPFRQSGLEIYRVNVKVPSPFSVTEDGTHVGNHFLSAVVEISENLARPDDQVLCFVPGSGDVQQAVDAFREATGRQAVGLSAQVDPEVVQKNLITGTVFFSTNVAETSITIPRLVAVVDMGRRKVGATQNGIFSLIDEPAPRSTLGQRRGRLGRVRKGVYYPTYQQTDIVTDFAKPELLLADLSDLEFRTWRGREKSLSDFQDLLPIAVQDYSQLQKQLDAVNEQAELIGMVKGGKLTDIGKKMMSLPALGVRWARCLVEAINYGIGGSVLMVCAAFKALPNLKSWVFKAIPAEFQDAASGDLGTLYNYARDAWNRAQKDETNAKGGKKGFNTVGEELRALTRSCKPGPKGPRHMEGLTLKIVREISNLRQKVSSAVERARREHNHTISVFLAKALTSKQCSTTDVIRTIFPAFVDTVAVSQKLLGGRSGHYSLLYKQIQSGMSLRQHTATIDTKSTLFRKPQDAIDLVFSVEVSHVAISEEAPDVLAVVNECSMDWLQQGGLPLCKVFAEIHDDEVETVDGSGRGFDPTISRFDKVNGNALKNGMSMRKFEGKPDQAVEALKFLAMDETMLHEGVGTLQPDEKMLDRLDLQTLKRNIKHYQDNGEIFNQWINTWNNTLQVDLKFKPRNPTNGVSIDGFQPKDIPWFKWKARVHHGEEISDSINVTMRFIMGCSVPKFRGDFLNDRETFGNDHPDIALRELKVLPYRIQGDEWADMRERIAQCCDSQRSNSLQWKLIGGPDATRASRMAAVAHVAITKHNLRLKGGFVRDWIVAGRSAKPDIDEEDERFWGTPTRGFKDRPEIHADFIPQDLDFQFSGPTSRWFDVMRFKSDVEFLGIPVTEVHVDGLLIIIVFDAFKGSRGPFTAEIALPHIAPTMVDIDFDCNNLCLELDYPKDLCMRIPHLGLTIPHVINRIIQKQFFVCKHLDSNMAKRVTKMEGRGWTNLGEKLWTPGAQDGYVRVPILDWKQESAEVGRIVSALQNDLGVQGNALGGGVQINTRIVRVFKLVNQALENSYTAAASKIVDIERNPLNEKFLWHGAPNTQDVKDGIAQLGIDNRFWSAGMFGCGGYFAEHPRKSHFFCRGSETRLIFYCKVATGKAEVLQGESGNPPCPAGHKQRFAPDKTYNCIRGEGHAPDATVTEYVIFNTAQAVPLYQIEYTGGD